MFARSLSLPEEPPAVKNCRTPHCVLRVLSFFFPGSMGQCRLTPLARRKHTCKKGRRRERNGLLFKFFAENNPSAELSPGQMSFRAYRVDIRQMSQPLALKHRQSPQIAKIRKCLG